MKQTHAVDVHSTPKQVFMQLFMIAMLYISVIASLVLGFQYMNQLFFDSVTDYRQSIFDLIRWGSSVIIIAYPALVAITYFINKEISADPDQRHMKLRRWLLYLTQFITALTIIIDLMVLVYQFYGGELTIRFALKIGIILLVAAVVLGYYRWELHRDYSPTKIPMITAIVVGVVLFSALIAGFFIAGTPADQRDIRMDADRIDDVSAIQWQIMDYITTNSTLPADQATLNAYITDEWGDAMQVDPETKEPYEYIRVSDTVFQLCATFARVSESDSDSYRDYPVKDIVDEKELRILGGNNWTHDAGRYCFEREIDWRESSNVVEPVVVE